MDCKSSDFLSINNLSKSQTILIYIMQNTDGGFGHIKMMKTILKADQETFKMHFRSFSGYSYTKDKYGPYSAMFQYDIDLLLQESFITEKEDSAQTYGVELKDRSWYKDYFSGEELKTLDDAIAAIRPLTSSEASEDTHDWVYDSIEDGEEIPLFLYLDPAPMTKEHKAEAMRLFNA